MDVTAGERTVELIRDAVESTRRPEVLSGLGGFAGAVGLPSGLRDPILVSATDGVGTKTAIASALDRFDTIGIDLVAMCADDVVCSGAAPLFFLDYVVVGRLDPGNIAELVGGVAAGCRTAGCALVGGETAEHPGMMGGDEFDLAGFCVGVMERDRWIDGSGVRPGMRSWVWPHPVSMPTGSRSFARCWPSTTSTCARRTRSASADRSGMRRPRPRWPSSRTCRWRPSARSS